MKKLINLSISFLLLIALFIPASALIDVSPSDGTHPPRLVDDANLLTDEERDSLLSKLNEISERQEIDIVLLTIDSLDYKTPTEYADDFYDYNGYGFGDENDGILLLLSIEERDWAISTTGYGIDIFTDADQEYLMDMILPNLAEDEFYDAFLAFADECDDIISQAKIEDPLYEYPERMYPRLVDDANLLTDEERALLLTKLNDVSERQEIDIVVLTINSLGYKTATEYADDFYDDSGYGFGGGRDGIILLLSMEERDFAISTTGYGIEVFTDAGQEYLMGKVLPSLGDDDFYNAFIAFADECDEFITQAKTEAPFDNYNLPKKPFSLKWIPISLLIGAVISLIIMTIMKSQLKTVRMQTAAANYIINDSFMLTGSRELFLYTILNKVPRPKESDTSSKSSGGGSSTHTSSSGTSHGGSSGKF